MPITHVTATLEFRHDDGTAFIDIPTGRDVLQIAMPTHRLIKSMRVGNIAIAEWEKRQRKPVRIGKKAG